MAADDLISLHMDACASQLAWCLVPYEPAPADLLLLARAMAADALAAFTVDYDVTALTDELLASAAARVVWRGEIDASERAEWQAARIQEAWAEVVGWRALREAEEAEAGTAH